MKALSQSPNTVSKNSFSKSDLESCADGSLFGQGNAQLPAPPLLMLDRIVDIQKAGGKYSRGFAVAEFDIDSSRWFFKSHFKDDPVMPGSLMVEALWQLAGFHLAWSGYSGKGRALDSGKTRFVSPVQESNQTLNITIHVRKIISNSNPVCIVDGDIRSNNKLICKSEAIKIGVFN